MDLDFDCVRNTKIIVSAAYIPGKKGAQKIRFGLYLQVETSNWIVHQDSTTPQFSGRDPPSLHTAEAMGYDIAKIIHRAIDDCGYALYDEERRDMIARAWAEWRRLPDTCTGLRFICSARVQHRHVYGILDSCPTTMVPAADSSLGLLDNYEVDPDTDCDCNCSICLEQLDGGGGGGDGALRMPCSHVFHGGCIKEWLRSSHYCPICRYEMPTQ